MATTDTWAQQLANTGQPRQPGQPSQNPYGLTDDQMKALATLSQNPSSGLTQSAHYGTGTIVRDQPSDQARQVLGILNAVGATGSGNQQQQTAPASTMGAVSTNPMYAAVNLGEAALNSVGLGAGGAIYNPMPTGATGPGGVGKIGSPISTTGEPAAPTGTTVPGVFTKATAATPTGQTPTSQMQQYFADARAKGGMGQMDPSTVDPTVAKSYWDAAHPATPATPPATAAPYSATPTPFATAPPAPGLSDHVMAAHTTGLENAGKALFAHFGGDPNSASPEDIMNFHGQLTSMMSGTPFGPAPAAAASYTAGVPQGPAAAGPVKMATGGWVYGNGNDDTVPALLKPGEYVLNRQQARQMAPEVRRATPANVGDTAVQPQGLQSPAAAATSPSVQSQGQTGQQGASNAPAAPGGYTGPTAAQIMAQNKAADAAIGSGGPGSLDSLGTLGDESLINSAGVGSGPGSGMPTQQAAGVVGGLASGLSAAAKAYADSVKPWRTQKYNEGSAIPSPDDFRRNQQITYSPMGA